MSRYASWLWVGVEVAEEEPKGEVGGVCVLSDLHLGDAGLAST